MIYFVVFFTMVTAMFGSDLITQESIRQNPAHSVTFEVNKPYQTVFANLMSASKMCYLHQPFDEQITVWGEKNNANKTANIRIEHVYDMEPHEMYIMVDIVSKAENVSSVTVYNADDTAQNSLKNYQQWADLKPTAC